MLVRSVAWRGLMFRSLEGEGRKFSNRSHFGRYDAVSLPPAPLVCRLSAGGYRSTKEDGRMAEGAFTPPSHTAVNG